MINVKLNSSKSLSFIYSIQQMKIIQMNKHLSDALKNAKIDLNQFFLDVSPFLDQKDQVIELGFSGFTASFIISRVGEMVIAQGQEVTRLEASSISSNKNTLSSEELHRMRLLSLGELTSGIIHDINNALGMSISSLELFKEDIKELETMMNKENSETNELFSNIKNQAEHLDKGFSLITQIAEGVRAFTHRNQVDFKNQDLIQILKSSHVFSRNFLEKSKIKLTISEHSELMLSCKESLLTQVFVNMIKNSHDAIETLPFHKKWIQVDVSEDNNYVMIDITDGGSGIPKELQNQIFKPFYTTKEIGKGTGLGLSMCNSILEIHGGKIEVNNKSSNTCFRLYISKKLGKT